MQKAGFLITRLIWSLNTGLTVTSKHNDREKQDAQILQADLLLSFAYAFLSILSCDAAREDHVLSTDKNQYLQLKMSWKSKQDFY